MDITLADHIDTFSFSGSISDTGVLGDWTIITEDGDVKDSSGELSLSDMKDEGIDIELEEDEVFRGEYTY